MGVGVRECCRIAGTNTGYNEPGARWAKPFVESLNGRVRDDSPNVRTSATYRKPRPLWRRRGSSTTPSVLTPWDTAEGLGRKKLDGGDTGIKGGHELGGGGHAGQYGHIQFATAADHCGTEARRDDKSGPGADRGVDLVGRDDGPGADNHGRVFRHGSQGLCGGGGPESDLGYGGPPAVRASANRLPWRGSCTTT
jgi:hypothetical protein